MISKLMIVMVGVVLVAGFSGVSMAESPSERGTHPDYEALAEKLVRQCAAIREGDLVQISGGVRDVELLENIATHVRKVGAFPLVTLASDRMARRSYEDVPAKYDSQTPEFGLKLAGIITAQIVVDSQEALDVLKDVPGERLAARSKAWRPAGDLRLERGVRQVYLGEEGGLYPTAERARLFGVSQAELAEVFWNGLDVDYEKLQVKGKAGKAALATGKEMHITNPNGTDLKVLVEGRPVFVSDGVISAEDEKTGGAACQIWLPAGDIYLAPVPGTAEGKVVIDRQLFQGKEILGLTLTFEAGKVTSMVAESGLEPLKARYDASSSDKDQFAFIDIGINPNVSLPPGSRIVSYMPAGMVTVGVGNNIWAAGGNDSDFGMSNFLPGSTLTVDGKVLVEDGKLKF
jgi:aminopeptidase